jgi:ligand-binding sensor domain-containing protein
VHNPLDPDSLAGNDVNGIAQDASGGTWIGTTSGLSQFDPASGRFVSFRASPDRPSDLTSSNVRFIDFDADGKLWLATAGGGLNHFDPRTGTATAYSQRQGLPYFSIRAMQADADGNLWLANEGWVARSW